MPGPDFTVTIEIGVTADSFEDAARYALDDLRDRSLELALTVMDNGTQETREVCTSDLEEDDDA